MTTVPLFWAIALALVAATLAVLVWPLLRRKMSPAPSEDAARTAIFRDQRRQLDDDMRNGTLAAADHAAATAELTQRLGVELDADALPPPRPPGGARWVAALAAVAIVPTGAIVLYLMVGAPQALNAASAGRERPDDAQIVAMVERLAAKMAANPADANGWRLLGRSYAALGHYDESARAYAEAAGRGGDDADVLADWAEVLALARNQSVAGEPEALAQRALAKNAHHLKALALLATGAIERGDFEVSIAYWRRLQVLLPPGSPEATQTIAAIAETEKLRGQAGGAGAIGGGPAGAAVATMPEGATTPAGAAPRSMPTAPALAAAAVAGAGVDGRIEIAAALASRVAAGDTLYVFARAVEGPRRPVAVQRTRVTSWPIALHLDDTMGMAGGAPLSSVAAVIVEARVSRTGDATPHAGDLVGRSASVAPGARDVRIVIDQVVP